MSNRDRSLILPAAWIVALATLLVSPVSCSRLHKSPEAASQKTFASPEAAEMALVKASKAGDQASLLAMFGPDSQAILFTGDAATDQKRLNQFVTAYNQMHRWNKIKAGGLALYVGADNFPFPIPLAKNSSGSWYFDTSAGRDEILARRIGQNELTAMDACQAIAGAEQKYREMTRRGGQGEHYAQKFVSDAGTQNGLFWPVSEGQTASPLGRFGDFAKAASDSHGGNSLDFNGYRDRILSWPTPQSAAKDSHTNTKAADNFAILAYPVEYRNSGIMSFLISNDGTVYQKDLGLNTADAASSLTKYDPADSWAVAILPATSAARTRP